MNKVDIKERLKLMIFHRTGIIPLDHGRDLFLENIIKQQKSIRPSVDDYSVLISIKIAKRRKKEAHNEKPV